MEKIKLEDYDLIVTGAYNGSAGEAAVFITHHGEPVSLLDLTDEQLVIAFNGTSALLQAIYDTMEASQSANELKAKLKL